MREFVLLLEFFVTLSRFRSVLAINQSKAQRPARVLRPRTPCRGRQLTHVDSGTL